MSCSLTSFDVAAKAAILVFGLLWIFSNACARQQYCRKYFKIGVGPKGFFMCNLVVVLERDFAESVVSNNFSRVNYHIRGEQGLNRVIFKVDVYSACDSSDIE